MVTTDWKQLHDGQIRIIGESHLSSRFNRRARAGGARRGGPLVLEETYGVSFTRGNVFELVTVDAVDAYSPHANSGNDRQRGL